MPGSSLWLVPPLSHPIHAILTSLITTTVPELIPQPDPTVSTSYPTFAPHLTLTSFIPPATYGSDPQGWLSSVAASLFPPRDAVRVRLRSVATEDVFFRRCYLRAAFDGVRDLAAAARAAGVEGEQPAGEKTAAWLEEWRRGFGPHVSLLYGNDPIDKATLGAVERAVHDAGIRLEDDEGEVAADTLDGWDGGVVWLVPTDKPISEWKPIATWEL